MHRLRLRSNSTGAKHSSPREQGGSRRFGNQLETPDRPRLSSGGKVPKSASVSALSLIITSDDGPGGLQPSPISPRSLSSNPSSRDSSPSRELALSISSLRPPILIHSSGKQFGFTLQAIRVYLGHTDLYTVHHVVSSVEEGSPAHEAGLRTGDLITHVNGESVQGLVHTEMMELLLKSGNKVALQTTALENTSIKIGPARKRSCKGKMARRSKKSKRRDNQDQRKSVLRRLSRQATVLRSSRSCSSGLQHSVSSSESLPGSPTHSLSPAPPTPCYSPGLDHTADSTQITSPSPGSPGTPSGAHVRPSSLHGLAPKLGQRFAKAARRKSTSSIPPSPLACTSSASACASSASACASSAQLLSPQRSPSPLPGVAKTLHSFHGTTLSPPSVGRHAVARPRSAEPLRSPLLKRVQSAERLAGSFRSEKKSYAPRRHTLEVPHCEVEVVVGEADGEAETSRCSGYLAARLRDWPASERAEQMVVMRKLNLSERRDSFKKQEAVQEVSFDEPEEKSATSSPTSAPATSLASAVTPRAVGLNRGAAGSGPQVGGSEEEGMARRCPLVPQIAVQGSESEELDDWEPCSDSEEEEGEEEEAHVEATPTETQQVGGAAVYDTPTISRTVEGAAGLHRAGAHWSGSDQSACTGTDTEQRKKK